MDDSDAVNPLGEYIRRQRELNEISMRQFATMAGISNPYLSQIERGHREPSHRVVEAIARSLQMSVDALYAQAGLTPEPEPGEVVERASVRTAISTDPELSPTQRKVLLDMYEALRAANHRGQERPEDRREAD